MKTQNKETGIFADYRKKQKPFYESFSEWVFITATFSAFIIAIIENLPN